MVEFIFIGGFIVESHLSAGGLHVFMSNGSSCAGNSRWIPASELHRKGHGHHLKPIPRIRLFAAPRGCGDGGCVAALLADGGIRKFLA